MRAKRRVVIVGAGSALGRRLCETYGDAGTDIVAVELRAGRLEEEAAACGAEPIDLLIFADDMDIDKPVSTAERPAMREALYRLTYAPFRFATLLRPAVAAAGGCVVLYSRATSRMERDAAGGRFVDRPFRAAAHALWKCLEVEWRDDRIRLRIVALRDPEDRIEKLCGDKASVALMVDASGLPLDW